MVKTIDATTTDRLRRSPLYLNLSPSCARKRACMELTIISRFQRLQASRKSLLHPLFYSFSVLSKYLVPTRQNRLRDLIQPPSKKFFTIRGFFAVKRRAVFILGAKWTALVRGWRRDCVVGGMETRSQWGKAHSRTAKCEAFHFAPRLFFMFLFLIPPTIRQQCIIYPQ